MKILIPTNPPNVNLIESSNVPDETIAEFTATPSPVYQTGDLVTISSRYPQRIYKWIAEADSASSDVAFPTVDIANNPAGKGVLGTYWQDIGVMMSWRPFDENIFPAVAGVIPGSFTGESFDNIEYLLNVQEYADAIAFFGLDSPQLRLRVYNDSSPRETVFDQTIGLIDDFDVFDYWEWFFAEIEHLEEAVVLNVPMFPGWQVDIDFGAEGYKGSLGEIIVAREYDVGQTITPGSHISGKNYDELDRDTFNYVTVVEQGYSRSAEYRFDIETVAARRFQKVWSRLRSSRAVLLIDDDTTQTGTLVYGILGDWDIDLGVLIPDGALSRGRLKIESVS